MSPPPPLRLD
jgi:hypothetical protein